MKKQTLEYSSHFCRVQLVLKLSKTCSPSLISRHYSLPPSKSNDFPFQQLIPDYKTRWIALYYISERILDWKVAIIEYIMYNDTREGIVLHSAQWSMLEHLFPILKMFMTTAKEVSAETASLSGYPSWPPVEKKNLPRQFWPQLVPGTLHLSLPIGKFSYTWKSLLVEGKQRIKGKFLVYWSFLLWQRFSFAR